LSISPAKRGGKEGEGEEKLLVQTVVVKKKKNIVGA